MDKQNGRTQRDHWWQKNGGQNEKTECQIPFKPGMTCPECGEASLRYDGLFVLSCPHCGHVAEHGVFT